MTSTEIRLDYKDLEAYLPHRGINILPDELVISADGNSGTTSTQVLADDARGRRIFGRDDGQGNWVWNEAFLGELMALTGVPLLAKELAAEGKVSVFSKISNVSMTRLLPMDAEIIGKTTITRRRSAFTVFSCQAYLNGEQVLDSEVLSGSAPLSAIAGSAVQSLPAPNGEALAEAIAAPTWKDPRMQFADSVLSCDPAAGTLLASYVYPTDHPLVPGHFPDAALMMGVTQWSAIADAAWEARRRFGLTGDISVDGRIYRPDGSEIVNVRDMQLAAIAGDAGCLPRLRSTNRIAFRDPIRPGDGVFIEVSVKAC